MIYSACHLARIFNKTAVLTAKGIFARYGERTFSVSSFLLKNAIFRTPQKFTKFKTRDDANDDENSSEVSFEDNDTAYAELAERAFRVADSAHNVLVIQPYIKWGPNKKRNTTVQLQLEESVTLIKTLNNWRVADQLTISLMSLDKSTLFGKGNLDKLEETVATNKAISAVFISVDVLKGSQRIVLEKLFKVPVFDRYSIVLQIFREHAVSKEAKIQLKLAEIPYVRARLRHLDAGDHFVGSGGETFLEYQHNLLKGREKKLLNEIKSLRGQRELLRKKRRKEELPIIAVVGYTNCGKTSLIKALTGEDSITPKNVLFATLDVTVHAGYLPSGLKVLYVDTIGFISDIPTTLLESFVATLEDALLADLIVHVRDVSHPDYKAQSEQVEETLRGLNLTENLMSNIVEVGNKVDLVNSIDESEWSRALLTSAVKLQGLEELKEKMEEAILRTTGRLKLDIRVRTSGEEYMWLRREATICQVRADEKDAQFSFVSVIITSSALAKFKHYFIEGKLKN